jgi:hypothetical protein
MSYSSAQTSSSVENDYMPLAIGNKWYYSVYTSEVVGIETIESKEYFKLEHKNVNEKFAPFYYYQRISNDTLYTLNFTQWSNLYFERVTAIFTLDSGDVARIELPPNELSSRNEAQGLPTGRKYSIKVTNKDEDTIEFFTYSGMIDGETTEVYKKGVGLIKTRGGWGGGIELIDYDHNN